MGAPLATVPPGGIDEMERQRLAGLEAQRGPSPTFGEMVGEAAPLLAAGALIPGGASLLARVGTGAGLGRRAAFCRRRHPPVHIGPRNRGRCQPCDAWCRCGACGRCRHAFGDLRVARDDAEGRLRQIERALADADAARAAGIRGAVWSPGLQKILDLPVMQAGIRKGIDIERCARRCPAQDRSAARSRDHRL